MKDNLIYAVISIICLIATAGLIYGAFRLTKSISYSVFYADLVRDTISEMVKQGCLK